MRPFVKAEDVVGKKPSENGASSSQESINGVKNTLKEEPKDQGSNGTPVTPAQPTTSEAKANTEKPATLF